MWYHKYFEYAEINGGVHSFCYRQETPFLGKFGPKTQNCQFKLTFGTWTNSKMRNSMAMFIFYILDRKYSFSKNLVQKVEIASLS